MNKKKVLYVITKSNFGGAQRYVFDLATSLKNDCDVVVAFGGQGALAQKLADAGVRTISIPSLVRDVNPLLDIKTFFDLIQLFKKERPDVVHLNSSKIGALGAVAARIARVPRIVFTGHAWAFNEDRNWFSKYIILKIHWITVMCSHVTIAVSEQVKKDIGVLPFVKNRIQVLHNGIAPIDFKSREESQKTLKIQDGFVIGTISELHKNKGLDYALQAFALFNKKHPETHFVIIGEGEERAYIEKLIKNLNLESSVTLTGFVKDAAQYLKAFDIFTLTSRTEAFPYVILEAVSAGLPIVASDVGGIPEVVTSEFGILTKPGDIQAITAALETVLTQPHHSPALSNFSLTDMVQKTKTLYGISNS